MAMDKVKPVTCYWCGKPAPVRKKPGYAYLVECPCGYRVTKTADELEEHRAMYPLDL